MNPLISCYNILYISKMYEAVLKLINYSINNIKNNFELNHFQFLIVQKKKCGDYKNDFFSKK